MVVAHVSLTDALAYAQCLSNISECIDYSSISRYFCIFFDISLLLLLKRGLYLKRFYFYFCTTLQDGVITIFLLFDSTVLIIIFHEDI